MVTDGQLTLKNGSLIRVATRPQAAPAAGASVTPST